jgi:hypothetical protein
LKFLEAGYVAPSAVKSCIPLLITNPRVLQAEEYYRCVQYPRTGAATPHDRGGYPMRKGDGAMLFTPDALKAAETECQGWVQFETSEYIEDVPTRDRVLDVMSLQGRNKAAGFIGPFDALMRGGDALRVAKACDDLIAAAADRGVFMGRVCGSGSCSRPEQVEDAMAHAIKVGCRLISVHHVTSDLPFVGAAAAAAPFWAAARRCGF